jgi:hypothetical protein
MPLALDLFPDLDGLPGLMEDCAPWIEAWAVILATILVAAIALQLGRQIRSLRSPVRKLMRGRHG